MKSNMRRLARVHIMAVDFASARVHTDDSIAELQILLQELAYRVELLMTFKMLTPSFHEFAIHSIPALRHFSTAPGTWGYSFERL